MDVDVILYGKVAVQAVSVRDKDDVTSKESTRGLPRRQLRQPLRKSLVVFRNPILSICTTPFRSSI